MVIQWWPANCKLSVKILGKIKISPFRVALFAMAMLGLTGCTSYTPANLQKDGWKRQNAAQLRAAIPETHFDVGENWMAFYDLGGSAKFKSLTDSFQDSGKWEITSAGKLCSTWIKIREGRKTCFAVWARTYWEKGNAFLIVSKRHVRRTITNENKLNGEYTWKSETREICDRVPFPQRAETLGRRSLLLHAESQVVRPKSASKLVRGGSKPLAKVSTKASAKSGEFDPRSCFLSTFVRPHPKSVS